MVLSPLVIMVVGGENSLLRANLAWVLLAFESLWMLIVARVYADGSKS